MLESRIRGEGKDGKRKERRKKMEEDGIAYYTCYA
jgi:hypothetical protein